MSVSNLLKPREQKTLNRIKATQKAAEVLQMFFNKGFNSYPAFRAVVFNFYPEISDTKLWDYWHIRVVSDEITTVLEDVFEKLKNE